MLPKAYRLQLRNEAGLFANSKKIRSIFLVVYVGKEVTPKPLFGVIVKKQLSLRSSERNKFKRWLRESARFLLQNPENNQVIKPTKYVLLLIQKPETLSDLKKDLVKAITRPSQKYEEQKFDHSSN